MKYACFISYRHFKESFGSNFVQEFVSVLNEFLELYMNEKAFLDEERLKTGEFFNQRLAEAICNSACMIIIYTPKHFSKQKPYCTCEYMAMKRLEKKRILKLKDKGKGLIITVVLRGIDQLPKEIVNNRHVIDFSALIEPKIKGNLRRRIEEIARYIFDVSMELRQADIDWNTCSNYIIPSEEEEEEVAKWLDEIDVFSPKLPLR